MSSSNPIPHRASYGNQRDSSTEPLTSLALVDLCIYGLCFQVNPMRLFAFSH